VKEKLSIKKNGKNAAGIMGCPGAKRKEGKAAELIVKRKQKGKVTA